MGSRTLAAFGSASIARFALVALVGLASACNGVIAQPTGGTLPGGSTTGGPGGLTQLPDGSFACDPARGPSASPLRRLSVLQYRNTLRDLFRIDARRGNRRDGRDRAPPGGRRAVHRSWMRVFGPARARVLPRCRQGGGGCHSPTRISKRSAALVPSKPRHRPHVSMLSSTSSGRAHCGDRFQRRSERRTSRSTTGAVAPARSFRSLVFVLLQAPSFAYHVEVDGDASRRRRQRLISLDGLRARVAPLVPFLANHAGRRALRCCRERIAAHRRRLHRTGQPHVRRSADP